jgi:hypothetical protein
MSRLSTLPPKWLALAEAVGGVAALAAACKVSEMSVRRWGAGAKPQSQLVRDRIAALARRYKVRNPLPRTGARPST